MMLNSSSNSAGRAPRARRPYTRPKHAGTRKTLDRGLWWVLWVALIAAIASGVQTMTHDVDDAPSVVAMPHVRHYHARPATDAATSAAMPATSGS